MARKSWVYLASGEVIERGEREYLPSVGPMVMGDIQPYRSMIDGHMVESRSDHRAHLRQHGCIEVGNELKAHRAQSKPMAPPPGLKERLIQVVNSKL